MHPPPPDFIHLHPAHFSLHPALCNTLNNVWTKILHKLGNFPKFRLKNLSILTENWHPWYFGGVDSESRLRFLKFRPQNPFLGKCGPENSKLSILSENWCTWYLKDADSYPSLVFWISEPNFLFGQIWAKKSQKLSVLTENWHRWYLEDADSYSNISFMNFQL